MTPALLILNFLTTPLQSGTLHPDCCSRQIGSKFFETAHIEWRIKMDFAPDELPSALQFEASEGYAIILTEADGRIVGWNEGAHQLYGYHAAEAIGRRNFDELLDPQRHEQDAAAMLRAASQAGVLVAVQDHLRKDGSPFAARTVIAPLRRPDSYLCVCHAAAKEPAFHDDWVARHFHDLRTPLNGILGFAALIHAGTVGRITEVQKEYLGDILTCARKLMQLITEIEEKVGERAPA